MDGKSKVESPLNKAIYKKTCATCHRLAVYEFTDYLKDKGTFTLSYACNNEECVKKARQFLADNKQTTIMKEI